MNSFFCTDSAYQNADRMPFTCGHGCQEREAKAIRNPRGTGLSSNKRGNWGAQ